jgi:hypothetical protein
MATIQRKLLNCKKKTNSYILKNYYVGKPSFNKSKGSPNTIVQSTCDSYSISTYKCILPQIISLLYAYVTTLALGLQLGQGHGKVQVGSATRESHSLSWECERV